MTSFALIATSDAADRVRVLARSDCAAIHWARQASENAVAVCPEGDSAAIEYALAAGIRTVYPLDESLPAEFDLAYVGTGSAELVGDIYWAHWAERSRASLLFDVIGCSEAIPQVREVECDAGRGARYRVSVRGPLIMVLSPHVARPAYVSRYRRHAAALRFSKERSSAPNHAVTPMHSYAWSTVRPRVRTLRTSNEPQVADDRLNSAFSIQAGSRSDTTNVIVADPETCARHLLRYLAHHSLVCQTAVDDGLEVPDVRQKSAEPRTTERNVPSNYGGSFDGFTQRRPRQADDSLARRARQPRPIGQVTQSLRTASQGDFMDRRPRHVDDSMERRARQPRPLERS